MGAVKKKQSALGEPERAQGGRLVSVLLDIIGVCAMLVVMWMTARQGWSLQDNIADCFASALMNVLVDAAAAVLVSASSSMLKCRGLRRKVMGVSALLFALILEGYSTITVYGFMSTRMAILMRIRKSSKCSRKTSSGSAPRALTAMCPSRSGRS